ncbi:unnamed protein product [Owenia fusiformis]|uniref:Uncharacterized protein n=1 Tax=Owenia fusiformis TaxID=6347 RepID=A0A8J1XTD9_OWEFU|nr:unnamed protein product [Owenia fusiformis]
MKIWSSEHAFSHPWETVVQAAWRKYPNPHNTSVVGIDVVDRKVDKGILKSHRLLSTEWGLPDWAARLIGKDKIAYGSEYSEVDSTSRSMTLKSRNITFCNYISIDETLIYQPHPEDQNRTLLKQEARVTVKNLALCSYFENLLTNNISKKADKGREAMEWVISKIKAETVDLSQAARQSMDSVMHNVSNLESTV